MAIKEGRRQYLISAPREHEDCCACATIAAALAPHPFTVRTNDGVVDDALCIALVRAGAASKWSRLGELSSMFIPSLSWEID
jgi:hypothetical protein